MLCDFGGTMLDDEASATAPTSPGASHVGEPPAEVRRGSTPCCTRRQRAGGRRGRRRARRARRSTPRPGDVIADAGYGEHFIHRTGHGIGVEEHEDPYIVAGNGTPLVAGHAFSIEPGIYIPGRFGLRLEDIVVATADGPDALNRADHALAVVDA